MTKKQIILEFKKAFPGTSLCYSGHKRTFSVTGLPNTTNVIYFLERFKEINSINRAYKFRIL